MKNDNFLIICLLTFLSLSVITDCAVLNTKEYEPDYRYFTNPIIITIYILSISLDISLFILILISISNKAKGYVRDKKIINSIYFILSLLILLIWIELIYASEWYYGFGNHQDGLIASNWGIIGSIIFSTYLILNLNKRLTAKLIWFVTIFDVHVLLFLILSPINICRL
jgi:hypothetical protein